MLKPPATVLAREIGREAVLLDLGSGAYFGLNEVAARAWREIVATGSLEAAHAALAAEFDVDPARLRSDMEALVADLRARSLLEDVDPLAGGRDP